MNLLDVVPPLERHIRQYRKAVDTNSSLAGYLADAIQALDHRWVRLYTVTYTAPATYTVDPDIDSGDIRPIVLMASIIYKMGNFSAVRFTDGDFSYDPTTAGTNNNPIRMDIDELKARIPQTRLATGFTAPMRGFGNIYNRENYDWTFLLDLIA